MGAPPTHNWSVETPLRIRTPRAWASYCQLVTAMPNTFQEFGNIPSRGRIAPKYQRSYTPRPQTRCGELSVELFGFDRAYVERLRDGDPSTEHHFVLYFEQLLRIKLRARMLASETVEELRQETFSRVIAALRKEGGIRQPERLGAFVNAICNNVLLEFYRTRSHTQPLEDFHLEKTDKVLDLEGLLVTRQSQEYVRQVLGHLPKKDHQVLRAIFLEEKDKDEVCRIFGVDRDYLRVLLHRAKDKFRVLYLRDQVATRRRATARSTA
jgi:RNA polymerase sigma-70 factor, ECF subfamily